MSVLAVERLPALGELPGQGGEAALDGRHRVPPAIGGCRAGRAGGDVEAHEVGIRRQGCKPSRRHHAPKCLQSEGVGAPGVGPARCVGVTPHPVGKRGEMSGQGALGGTGIVAGQKGRAGDLCGIVARASSRCDARKRGGLRHTDFQAAATTSCHVLIAAVRSTRCD